MISYLDTKSTLHTRGIDISREDYLFGLMVVFGDEKEVAYGLAYEPNDFAKVIGKEEDEQAYLSSKKGDVDSLMSQQHIIQLMDVLTELHRTEIQKAALNLTDYKFSGEETVQILNSLLKTRVDDLESSSVKDVVGIIKMLADQGALETGDGGFSKHFIMVHDKYPALCQCGREFDCYAGLGARCPHCGQEYVWSEQDQRFYPQISKL